MLKMIAAIVLALIIFSALRAIGRRIYAVLTDPAED